MNPIIQLRQQGTHQPFLPHEFHKAPQYALYAPAFSAPSSVPPAAPSLQRTTSKIKPASQASSKMRGQPSKVRPNALKRYLERCRGPADALARLPALDDIVTGAVNLDLHGNTRPLGKRVLLVLLRRLDVISTASVHEQYELMYSKECTVRHAQRLALCLRIIDQSALKLAATLWSPHSQLEIATHDIVPCGKETCSVCMSGLSTIYSWDQALDNDNQFCNEGLFVDEDGTETFYIDNREDEDNE